MDGEHHRTNAILDSGIYSTFQSCNVIIGVTNTFDSAFQIFTGRLNEFLSSVMKF